LALTRIERLRDSDIVVTVVGTPVDEHLNPSVLELYQSIDTPRC